jgi:ferrochelatase
VVELPRLLWWPILHLIILPTRPRQSAQKYASIWTPDGSPLAVHTRAQATLLKGYLGNRAPRPVQVDFAMRYGEPSVEQAILRLKAAGCERLLVLPLYPQYAASSTGSVFDAVAATLARLRNPPELRLVKHFHDHPGYIAALAESVREHWAQHGRPEKLLMSFHGVPRRSLEQGDPYHCECQKTGRLLAEALGLAPHEWQVTFQSRFGRAEWLKPYTQPTLEALARQGVGRVDVICPGFVADCLETLEEIAVEAKRAFLAAGGRGVPLHSVSQRAPHLDTRPHRPHSLPPGRLLARGSPQCRRGGQSLPYPGPGPRCGRLSDPTLKTGPFPPLPPKRREHAHQRCRSGVRHPLPAPGKPQHPGAA